MEPGVFRGGGFGSPRGDGPGPALDHPHPEALRTLFYDLFV